MAKKLLLKFRKRLLCVLDLGFS